MSRRAALTLAIASLSSSAFAQGSSSPQAATTREFPRPDPTSFQPGDFVWPKKPGAFVPYNAGSQNSPEQDRNLWNQEREAYLKTIQEGGALDPETKQRIEILRNMDYREFLAVYVGDQKIGVPGAYSGSGVYVGHVGIISIEAGVPWVTEAVIPEGVRKVNYSDWIAGRPGQVVWQGRVRQLPSTDREKIAVEAGKYIGRPYKFWNFNLNDDSGFYCSKLVWLSIYRCLKFPIDGNENTKRVLWFSPKQLLNQQTIDKVFDPGSYAWL